MSENKHTPEPWSPQVDDSEPFCFGVIDGDIRKFVGFARTEADRRRIVACVNRLAGFATEQIEDIGYDLFAEDRPKLYEAQLEIVSLRRQRDAFKDAADYNKSRAEEAEQQRDEALADLAKMTSEKYPFVHLRIDASEAEQEEAIKNKLVELGWATPKQRDKLLAAIESMRVAGGSAEFQAAFDMAKQLAASVEGGAA